jgi:hypothetical protein
MRRESRCANKSDDVTMIEYPLSEPVTSVHLNIVLKKLRDLTGYLPSA